MTYRIAFAAGAAAQFHNLPKHARDAVVHRAADLVERPWDGVTALPPGDDPAFQEVVFGNGPGLLAVHVNETDELIRIFNILWLE